MIELDWERAEEAQRKAYRESGKYLDGLGAYQAEIERQCGAMVAFQATAKDVTIAALQGRERVWVQQEVDLRHQLAMLREANAKAPAALGDPSEPVLPPPRRLCGEQVDKAGGGGRCELGQGHTAPHDKLVDRADVCGTCGGNRGCFPECTRWVARRSE